MVSGRFLLAAGLVLKCCAAVLVASGQWLPLCKAQRVLGLRPAFGLLFVRLSLEYLENLSKAAASLIPPEMGWDFKSLYEHRETPELDRGFPTRASSYPAVLFFLSLY